jgi:pyruvate formate lyase activating enzyme
MRSRTGDPGGPSDEALLAGTAHGDEWATAAKELGAASLAFTYNDPAPFLEFAIDCADAAHEVGLRIVAVTAGYVCPRPRIEMFAHVDAASIDLKAFTERFYKQACGAELGAVLETLEYLRNETEVWLEITNLLIPDANDSDAEIDAKTSWVVDRLGPDVPMHFTAFHPDFKMTDRPPTPPGTLSRARRIALTNGVHYAYTGNIHDTKGASTYCPGCGIRLVERDWYELGEYRLTDDGHCQNCGTRCPGVYEGPAGTWDSVVTPCTSPGSRPSEALRSSLASGGEADRVMDDDHGGRAGPEAGHSVRVPAVADVFYPAGPAR